MTLLQTLRRRAVRNQQHQRSRRRVAPEVSLLEERALLSAMDADLVTTASVNGMAVTIDQTAPVITITSVSPSTLWPPNGKLVPVTVMGTVSDTGSGVTSPLTVHIRNEPGYSGGIVLPSSPVTVQATSTNPQTGGALTGTFDFTVMLQARRFGFDFDGRQYTIQVTATDAAGNASTASTVVTVPHDQGNHNGGQPRHGHGENGGGDGNSQGGESGKTHGHGHKQGSGENDGGDGNSQGQGSGHSHGNGHGSKNSHGHGNGSGNSHGHGHGG